MAEDTNPTIVVSAPPEMLCDSTSRQGPVPGDSQQEEPARCSGDDEACTLRESPSSSKSAGAKYNNRYLLPPLEKWVEAKRKRDAQRLISSPEETDYLIGTFSCEVEIVFMYRQPTRWGTPRSSVTIPLITKTAPGKAFLSINQHTDFESLFHDVRRLAVHVIKSSSVLTPEDIRGDISIVWQSDNQFLSTFLTPTNTDLLVQQRLERGEKFRLRFEFAVVPPYMEQAHLDRPETQKRKGTASFRQIVSANIMSAKDRAVRKLDCLVLCGSEMVERGREEIVIAAKEARPMVCRKVRAICRFIFVPGSG